MAALDEAITRLREETGARRVALVGYSGGGLLAALIAARRADVASLVTLSAPLPLDAWRAHHGLGPLDAVDPASLPPGPLDAIPQHHFVGARDEVVPASLLQGWCRARAASDCRVEVVDVDHGGWRDGWAERIEALRAP